MTNFIRNKLDVPGEAFYLVAGAAGFDERTFGSNPGRTKFEILDLLANLLDIGVHSAWILSAQFKRAACAKGKDFARKLLNDRVRELTS